MCQLLALMAHSDALPEAAEVVVDLCLVLTSLMFWAAEAAGQAYSDSMLMLIVEIVVVGMRHMAD